MFRHFSASALKPSQYCCLNGCVENVRGKGVDVYSLAAKAAFLFYIDFMKFFNCFFVFHLSINCGYTYFIFLCNCIYCFEIESSYGFCHFVERIQGFLFMGTFDEMLH